VDGSPREGRDIDLIGTQQVADSLRAGPDRDRLAARRTGGASLRQSDQQGSAGRTIAAVVRNAVALGHDPGVDRRPRPTCPRGRGRGIRRIVVATARETAEEAHAAGPMPGV
jgi:hypothetical protein